ncbi:MAG TPA: hypothetical protein VM618_04370 [Acidimicrobiia bacterium]|nr:hypothetical protein [Acidimicrobiia bacterium]
MFTPAYAYMNGNGGVARAQFAAAFSPAGHLAAPMSTCWLHVDIDRKKTGIGTRRLGESP